MLRLLACLEMPSNENINDIVSMFRNAFKSLEEKINFACLEMLQMKIMNVYNVKKKIVILKINRRTSLFCSYVLLSSFSVHQLRERFLLQFLR